MRLASLQARRYRSLLDADIAVGDLNLFIGANASGKSVPAERNQGTRHEDVAGYLDNPPASAELLSHRQVDKGPAALLPAPA